MIMDIQRVMELLPHRYPFLLVDKVTECVPGERLVAVKNVTFNEPFFTGHFPIKPVMPGVLIIEALAQATGLLSAESGNGANSANSVYYLVGVDKARFKRPVGPGDQLVLEANLAKVKRDLWMFECEAKVDGKVVASAEIMCTAREV
jgi:3-hydroxyacyl-[acyl-carrier-protein] dehydratase